HSNLRDTQLCAARARKYAGLSRAAGKQSEALDRRRSSARRLRAGVEHPSSTLTQDAGRRGSRRSIFVPAPDGLRLHVCQHGAATSSAVPVVCLSGLTRTTADFDDLAQALAASEPARRVFALDSRGRGQSDYDPNPKNYTPAVELADLI